MSSAPISRGFRGRGGGARDARVPPGQHLVEDFPVLSAGPTPPVDLANWRLSLQALPQTDLTVDIHCVTTWSKLDTNWKGVSIDTLLEAAGLTEPPQPYVLAHCDGGYTTNIPAEDLLDGKAMIAWEYEGEALDPEHGGPARLLVPHLYFWKSAKWVQKLLGRERLSHLRRSMARAAL